MAVDSRQQFIYILSVILSSPIFGDLKIDLNTMNRYNISKVFNYYNYMNINPFELWRAAQTEKQLEDVKNN